MSSFPLEEITQFAVADQMKLLFTIRSGIMYEVESATPRSALKYREIFKTLTVG